MDLGLQGLTLLSEHVEYSAVLNFTEEYVARIESPFTVHLAKGNFELSPESDPPESFEPVRELLGQTVSESIVADSGTLKLTFANGASVQVEPDDDYEAWTVAGPRGMLIVCMPGGELAIWEKQDE